MLTDANCRYVFKKVLSLVGVVINLLMNKHWNCVIYDYLFCTYSIYL
jgi:hypothetical protein